MRCHTLRLVWRLTLNINIRTSRPLYSIYFIAATALWNSLASSETGLNFAYVLILGSTISLSVNPPGGRRANCDAFKIYDLFFSLPIAGRGCVLAESEVGLEFQLRPPNLEVTENQRVNEVNERVSGDSQYRLVISLRYHTAQGTTTPSSSHSGTSPFLARPFVSRNKTFSLLSSIVNIFVDCSPPTFLLLGKS
jgi:hypothetical protein